LQGLEKYISLVVFYSTNNITVWENNIYRPIVRVFLIRRGEFAVKEGTDSLFYKKVPMIMMNENDPLRAPKLESLNFKLQMVPVNSTGKQTHSALLTSTMYTIFVSNTFVFTFSYILWPYRPFQATSVNDVGRNSSLYFLLI